MWHKWPNLPLPDISVTKYLPKSVSYVEYDYHTGKILNVIGKALWFWGD